MLNEEDRQWRHSEKIKQREPEEHPDRKANIVHAQDFAHNVQNYVNWTAYHDRGFNRMALQLKRDYVLLSCSGQKRFAAAIGYNQNHEEFVDELNKMFNQYYELSEKEKTGTKLFDRDGIAEKSEPPQLKNLVDHWKKFKD